MLELLIHATPAGAVDHVVVIHGELLVRAVVVRLARPRRHCGIIIVRTAMIRSRTNTAALRPLNATMVRISIETK
jgi:hypothetical protein